MNPLSLTLRKVGVFDDITLDLPEGLLAILGSNGAGKSTLINSIDIALFGPEGRSLADLYPRGSISTEPLQIELVFEHGGQTYRVRRSFNPKGRGTSKTDLERAVPDYDESDLRAGIALAREGTDPGLYYDRWEPLTVESQSATNEQITRLIGLSRETFRASSFLAQGEAGRFANAAPRERKRILSEIVGVDEWDKWLQQARTEKREVESELDRIAGSLERAESELAEREQIEREHAEAVTGESATQAKLEQTLAALTTAREALSQAHARTESRATAQRAAQEASQALSTWNLRIEAVEDDCRVLEERLGEKDTLEGVAGQHERLTRDRDELRAAVEAQRERERIASEQKRYADDAADLALRIGKLRERAREVLDGIGKETCDRCGQTLHEDAARRAAGSYSDEADGLVGQFKAAVAKVDALTGKLEQLGPEPEEAPDASRLPTLERSILNAQDAKERLAALGEVRARLEARRKEINEMRAELPARERAVIAAREGVDALGPHDPLADDQLARRVVALESEEASARRLLTLHQASVARAAGQLERLDTIAAEVAGARVRREVLHVKQDLLANMERACGPNGVPALLLENIAIPQVEVEASRILGLLGGPAFACELRTLREKKDGGVSDVLDIVLLTEAGDRTYETFSGGEQARISFALRLALAQLLASRKGASTGLLVIDELEGLDAQGIAALVEVLEGLQRSIPRIVVVSHNAELRDAFAETLSLENVDGQSRIVGADLAASVDA